MYMVECMMYLWAAHLKDRREEIETMDTGIQFQNWKNKRKNEGRWAISQGIMRVSRQGFIEECVQPGVASGWQRSKRVGGAMPDVNLYIIERPAT